MEKFSSWNDRRTGVNPFLAPAMVVPKNPALKALRYVVGAVLVVVRLPVAALLWGMLLLLAQVFQLVPAGLRYVLRLYTEAYIARLLLFVLGFHNISIHVPNSRAVTTRDSKHLKGSSIRSGDIIISSSHSFLERLYLSYKFGAVFGETSMKGGLRVVDLPTAVKSSTGIIAADCPGELAPPARTAKVIADGWSGPLVLFPEGARTLGTGVLRFAPVAEEVYRAIESSKAKRKPAVHVVAFRYTFANFAPMHTAGGTLKHIVRLCWQLNNTMTMVRSPLGRAPRGELGPSKCIQPADIPDLGEDAVVEDEAGTKVEGAAAWVECTRILLAKLLSRRTVRVSFTAVDHVEFVDFFLNPDKKPERVAAYIGRSH